MPPSVRHQLRNASGTATVIVSMIGCWLPIQVLAIDIRLMEGASNPFPAADPDGRLLSQVLGAAAQRYERILRDEWSLQVEFRYGNLSSGRAAIATTAHRAQFDPTARPEKRRTTFGTIVFNPSVNWFFDPTPLDDVEFRFEQMIYGKLRSEQQQAWYADSPTDGLEVAYLGRSADISALDAVSIAIHELGHLLGVENVPPETDDRDFDFPPDLVHGGQMAALSDRYAQHLLADGTSLGTSVRLGERRLPSATDIFAMAATAGWQEIDLPRKEFWGGSEWHEAFNWAGNRLPNPEDDVFLRSGGSVSLSGEATAGRLFLESGTQLTLSGHRLQIRDLHLGNNSQLATSNGFVTGERLFMQPSATLAYEVGEATPLIFLEQAKLAGTLDLSFATGSKVKIGDMQAIILSQELTGEFVTVVRPYADVLAGGNLLLESVQVGPGIQQLSAHVTLPGDMNADGTVDQADLNAVLLGWGTRVPAATIGSGDLDGNGLIEQADLNQVSLHWGTVTVGPSGSLVNVPEPTAWTLALITCAASILRSLLHQTASQPPVAPFQGADSVAIPCSRALRLTTRDPGAGL